LGYATYGQKMAATDWEPELYEVIGREKRVLKGDVEAWVRLRGKKAFFNRCEGAQNAGTLPPSDPGERNECKTTREAEASLLQGWALEKALDSGGIAHNRSKTTSLRAGAPIHGLIREGHSH